MIVHSLSGLILAIPVSSGSVLDHVDKQTCEAQRKRLLGLVPTLAGGLSNHGGSTWQVNHL